MLLPSALKVGSPQRQIEQARAAREPAASRDANTRVARQKRLKR